MRRWSSRPQVMEHLLARMRSLGQLAEASRARTEQAAPAAQQQGSAMEELADASQSMAELAAALHHLAGRFRVSEPPAHAGRRGRRAAAEWP